MIGLFGKIYGLEIPNDRAQDLAPQGRDESGTDDSVPRKTQLNPRHCISNAGTSHHRSPLTFHQRYKSSRKMLEFGD